jgi:hypothetical protein
MSRSYKKHPVVIVVGGNGRTGKRLANKRLRRYRGHVPRGSWWKRLYESWDIVDWKTWWADAPGKSLGK